MSETTPLIRADGRACDALRPVSIQTDFLTRPNAAHALIRTGETMVLCTASIEERVVTASLAVVPQHPASPPRIRCRIS